MASKLDRLEAEVEASRERLTQDLDRLRSTSIYADFLGSLKDTAIDAKDAVVDDIKVRSQSAVHDALDMVRAKAVSNPVATLAIAAGIVRFLLQRPPISIALIGAGIFGLFRTQAHSKRRFHPTRESLMEHVSDAGENLREQASDAAASVAASVKDGVSYVKEKAAALTNDVKDKAVALAEDAADTAGSVKSRLAKRVSNRPSLSAPDVRRATPVSGKARSISSGRRKPAPSRDTMLLGAAALAVGSAVALIMQRRTGEAANAPAWEGRSTRSASVRSRRPISGRARKTREN